MIITSKKKKMLHKIIVMGRKLVAFSKIDTKTLWSSWLWHRVVLQVDTDVLDEHATSIFKAEGTDPR